MKRTALARKTPIKAVSKRKVKCAGCGELFVRDRSGQKSCSVACSIAHVQQEQINARTAPYLPKRGKLTARVHDKRRAIRLCQTAFNALVRYLDRDRPCATCPATEAAQWDCGHFLTTAAHPELRYRIENASRQCSVCNQHHSGRPKEHREAIIARRGQGVMDWLEGPHDPAHWTIDELDRMASAMRAQLRWEKRRSINSEQTREAAA